MSRCSSAALERGGGAAAVDSVGGGERRVSGSGAASPVGEEVTAGEVFFGRSFGGGERYSSVSRATIGVAAERGASDAEQFCSLSDGVSSVGCDFWGFVNHGFRLFV